MPRLSKSTRQQRFDALVGIIGRYKEVNHLTMTKLAPLFGMSRQLLRYKLNHPSTFNYGEISLILEVTQPDEHERIKLVS